MMKKKSGIIEEFKKFITRGNVMDMAVGVIVGGAFTTIVTSLNNDIISPILGIFGGVDFSDLKSVSRYCDEKSLDVIRKRLEKFVDIKIKFIDSGNYHYISYLILEKITKPFTLVLFDHHTDMQPSYFEELMSCGCWVKKTLDDNKYIEKVIIIGADENLINSIEEKYREKIICFSEDFIREKFFDSTY